MNPDSTVLVIPPPALTSAPVPQGNTNAPDYARVARALASIPNQNADYNTWLLRGMALHSTGEFWARGLWDSWSRQSGKCDDRKQEKSWRSFTSDGIVTSASLSMWPNGMDMSWQNGRHFMWARAMGMGCWPQARETRTGMLEMSRQPLPRLQSRPLMKEMPHS
jgi:hypothetical protein